MPEIALPDPKSSINFKSLFDLISHYKFIITATISSSSLIKMYILYKQFGINIFKYTDVKSVITFFIPDILVFLTYALFFVLITILLSVRKWYLGLVISILITCVWAWEAFAKYPEIPMNIGYGYEQWLAPCILIGILIAAIFLHFYKNEGFKNEDFYLVMVVSFITFLSYSILTGYIEYDKASNGFYGLIDIYKSEQRSDISKFSSSDNVESSVCRYCSESVKITANGKVYIGETSDYIFVYDSTKKQTNVLKKEDVGYLVYRKNSNSKPK